MKRTTKPPVILYVGELFTADHIRNLLKRHTSLLSKAIPILKQNLESTPTDHADAIIYECRSMIKSPYRNVEIDIDLLPHAIWSYKKGIKVLFLSRNVAFQYRVFGITSGTLDDMGTLPVLQYHFDSKKTFQMDAQVDRDRYFNQMDWKSFEKHYLGKL